MAERPAKKKRMSVIATSVSTGERGGNTKVDLSVWGGKLALNFMKFKNGDKPDTGFIALNNHMSPRVVKLLGYIVRDRLTQLSEKKPYNVVEPIEIVNEISVRNESGEYVKKVIGKLYIGAKEFQDIGNRVYLAYEYDAEKIIQVVFFTGSDFNIPQDYLGNHDKSDEDLYSFHMIMENTLGKIFEYNLAEKQNDTLYNMMRGLFINAGLIKAPNWQNGNSGTSWKTDINTRTTPKLSAEESDAIVY